MVNYTNSVKQALKIAETIALKTSNLIGTEHILFGMLCIEDSIACRVLAKHGITKEVVSIYINPSANLTITLGDSPYSPKAKSVKQVASLIAHELKQEKVTLEHFLLAIIDDEKCIASQILSANGVDLQKMKSQFLTELKNNKNGIENFDFNELDDPFANSDNGGKIIDENTIIINVGNSNDEDDEDYYNDDYYSSQYDDREAVASGDGYYYDDYSMQSLKNLGIDVTQKALEGKLDPVIGRDDEIDRVIQVLCRRTKNNPILLGEPGVGKSAIADGLAQKIVHGKVPEILKGKIVFSLDLASMVAGTKYRGEFEEKFINALNVIKDNGNIILFIDEIHTLVGAGSGDGAPLDAANILKPMLARGELQLVGATTFEEYRKYIEKDSALERRFQPVTVEPPSVEDTITILKGLRSKYETHHRVAITDSAIKAAAELSDRYITDRFLPDKAIDLIDEAASKKRISANIPDEVDDISREIRQLQARINNARDLANFAEVDILMRRKNELMYNYNQNIRQLPQHASLKLKITGDDIAEIVSDWTHVPVTKLTESESKRLMNLEEILKGRVVGQDEAVSSVARAIKRARAGLQDPNRPIGSFIFLGPTGVGKTELSKALAEVMFGDENSIIRVDMSEYMDKSDVAKLIGSAPGLVGYEEGGQLTEKVRRHPYSVVLFDEIEKAHSDIFNILLQVLDDGRITDGHGRTVNFKNTIIIMTSNIGASDIAKSTGLGFSRVNDTQNEYEHMKEVQMQALKKAMRPEFVNRIDEIIVFRKLHEEQLKNIANILLNKLTIRLKQKGISLFITDLAKAYIVKSGTDTEYGARPLRRTIQRLIEDRLSEEILIGNIAIGDSVQIDLRNGNLVFSKM